MTSLCIMLLEVGMIPVRFFVMKKRMMYWHHLVTDGKMKLAAKVLEEQRKKPLKGDLHQQCVQDFIKLELEESEVESMSKGAF